MHVDVTDARGRDPKQDLGAPWPGSLAFDELERPAGFDGPVALPDAFGLSLRNRATRSRWNAKYPEPTARSLSLSSAFNFPRAKKGTAGNRWCAV